MKNGLLFEFLQLKQKQTFFHEEEDEFEKEVPDNNYTGDLHFPDHDNVDSDNSLDIDRDKKRELRKEFEKEVPDNEFSGDALDSDLFDNDDIKNAEQPSQMDADGEMDYPKFDNIESDEDEQYNNPQMQQPEVPTQHSPPEQINQQSPVDPNNMQPAPEGIPPQSMDGGIAAGIPPMMDGQQSAGLGGMDPMMMGMVGQQSLDPSSIGKVFILKKIYSRLISINSNLQHLCSPEFDELKSYVDESIDHFQNVIKNFDQFKDKLDDIITLYQKFLVIIVSKVEGILSGKNESYE